MTGLFRIVGWGERSEAQHDYLKFKDGCVGLRVAHPNLRPESGDTIRGDNPVRCSPQRLNSAAPR